MRYDLVDMVAGWGVAFGLLHLVLGVTTGGFLRLYGFGVGAALLLAFGGAWWWRNRSNRSGESP